jgi:diaminopimelate decarboxylase
MWMVTCATSRRTRRSAQTWGPLRRLPFVDPCASGPDNTVNHFRYISGELHCERVRMETLVDRVGTPAYIYSKRTLTDHFENFTLAFAELKPLVCFSVKSLSNIHLVRCIVELGGGIDVVSGGELFRARAADAPMERVVVAGVGKTEAELRLALSSAVGWLNVESAQEFELAASIARELGCQQRAALRVNPDVADSATHVKTTTGRRGGKFGFDIDHAEDFFRTYGKDPWMRLSGLHVHIGSPIHSAEPYVRFIEKLLALRERLTGLGFRIDSLDLGGGFPASYESEAPAWSQYAERIVPLLRQFKREGGTVILEPGRTVSANAGVLVSRVQYVKESGGRRIAVLDTGMNHLVRAAMYDAYHFIWPVTVDERLVPSSYAAQQPLDGLFEYDIVGPICESSDYFATGRRLPELRAGDLVCIYSAGAYGMVMASQYNANPRPPEVMVDGSTATIIRRRETYEDLVAPERATFAVDL